MAVISQYQVVIPGQIITAALWNAMELNIINNGLIPAGIEDYSTNDAQAQTQTDPYPAASLSKATALSGEIAQIRYQLAQILGETYWYIDPDVDIATFKTRFDAHTHDGTANNGPQIAAGGLATNAVTTVKINALAVTDAKINDVATTKLTGTIATAQIAANAVDETKLAASVAGSGLAGGAGTALSVGVDNSTIEINSDALRVKDSGIVTAKIADTNVTEAKLATAVVNKLGQNIGIVAIAAGNVSYTGQGRLKGVCSDGVANVTITLDGVTVVSGAAMTAGQCFIWNATGLAAGAGSLDTIDLFFRTSLTVTKNSGAGTISTAYERAA